ncbi:YitT family protein [Limimaricola cinnabarinus]|uniref:YitT family protein n=1 Tax=Limimaricola cinnabarinus TaxID=1125964 RepID=UPI0024915EC8|nr:YitT family protein [Limimaricola cinnabarinus]
MRSTSSPTRHSALEDLQGLSIGIFACSLGIHVLTHVGLITGQTAGVAVILSYLTGWSFGAVFFVVNLPFYWLAWLRLGPEFTVKSVISVTLLSLVTEALPGQFTIAHLDPWLGAVIFGVLVGLGLLGMFRHNGSLGGLGIVALIVQDRYGFRAGYVQLAADAVIFTTALALFDLPVVLWSLLGAAILNMVIAFNHRRDRYIAT